MTQHDYNIANAPGATVRADLNNLFQAIAENNSGSSAPSTTFAHQWWYDTANNLLKQRNAANTAWVTVAAKDGSGWRVYHNGTELAIIGQSEAEAGTATTARLWTAERVGQAIAALAGTVAHSNTAAASQTNIDFTGIASDARRITLILDRLQFSNSDDLVVTIGDVGGFETNGYDGVVSVNRNGQNNLNNGMQSGDGFLITNNTPPNTGIMTGYFTLWRASPSSQLVWMGEGRVVEADADNDLYMSCGWKVLSAALDRVRLTTTGGSSQFNSGSVGLFVE